MKKLMIPMVALTELMRYHIGEIPRTIKVDTTVGEVEVPINNPAIQSLIASIATEEKAKLYKELSSLEALRGQNKLLAEQITTLTTALQQQQAQQPTQTPQPPVAPPQAQTQPVVNKQGWDLSTLTEDQQRALLAQIRAAANPENTPAISPDQIQASMLKAFTEALSPVLQQLQEAVIAPSKEKQFAEYKSRRIAELSSEGPILPEVLDSATTQEEFEANVPLAKSLGAKYAATPTQQTPPPSIPPKPIVVPPPMPIIPQGPLDNPLNNVRGMNMEEYAKNRETLLKAAESAANGIVIGG